MPPKTETFEKSLERLERIVGQLESGDLPLEKGVALYKEGLALAGSCRKRLSEARMEVTLAGERGPTPFDPDAAPAGETEGTSRDG